MLTTLISFFGGSVFKMLWGEIASWLTAKQEHAHELERIRVQAEIESAQFERNQLAIRTQAELGVKTIAVQGEADLAKLDAATWGTVVEATTKSTGIWFVDAWNGSIRPALATECMLLWSLSLWRNNWTLTEQDWALVGAALGIFLADRSLMKRGK